jgi:predicted DsbA family dithiol-disulfide isomerase
VYLSAVMTDRVRFQYWSDPLCIWAFVAQDRLDRVLHDFAGKLDVDYHVVPVFGSVPWRFERGPWAAGGVAARVEATRKIAHEHGHPEVDGECWRGDCPASSWSPGMAIEAVAAMVASGEAPPDAFTRYQWEVRRRFFVERDNVARRAVQLAIARDLDIPVAGLESRLDDGSALAALWEDHREVESQRIEGSPTYVFDNGRAKLYGNFPFGVLHATVEELTGGLALGSSSC